MKKNINFIIGLVIIILSLITIYYIIRWISENNTIGIPLFTATLGFIGIIYSQYQSKSRDIRESHRASKIETYRMFFDLVNLFQNDARKNISIDLDNEEFQKNIQELTENMMLWASEEVIIAWRDFKNIESSSDDPYLALRKIDKLYRAIRKDLGHNDNNLKDLDLIKINLKDPENLN